jgi:hypothetical protein
MDRQIEAAVRALRSAVLSKLAPGVALRPSNVKSGDAAADGGAVAGGVLAEGFGPSCGRIRNEVRRLYGLTEVSKMRSEWDLLPLDENEQPQSVFKLMMGSIPDPREETEQNEEEAFRELVMKTLTRI